MQNNISLSNLFSDAEKEKYQRIIKPREFPERNNVDANVGEKSLKRKKPKSSQKAIALDSSESIGTKIDETERLEATDSPSDATTLRNEENTVFVGNVPISYTLKKISSLFGKCGDIESLRMRSVPTSGTAVDDHGNQNLVKKVCSNSKMFGDQKGSFNAYVVFRSKESVESALQLNGTLVDGRHLRVDKARPTLFDPKRTVFLGSLHHYSDEEELREHFSKVIPP